MDIAEAFHTRLYALALYCPDEEPKPHYGVRGQLMKVYAIPFCRRFEPGGSLDRRVNCRRVPQPRWVGARRSAKGGREAGGRQAREVKPAAFVFVPRPGRVRLQ
jgi:hypothetical protein